MMRWAIGSAMCCAIAFNLTFLIQEVALFLPKALIPGVSSTLFHNNHIWQGEHPLVYLFQGAGALATVVSGLLCLYVVQRGQLQSAGSRLFFLWMGYHGFFMALPQVVIGAVNPYNDVGMAMDYFNLTAGSKKLLALLALVAMPLVANLFTEPFLRLAPDSAAVTSRGDRTRFIARIVTVPALIAVLLVIPFRLPREWLEVIVLPLIVMLAGTVWVQAGAWRISIVRIAFPLSSPPPLKLLSLAAITLLLVFQLVLRPGITLSLHEDAVASSAQFVR